MTVNDIYNEILSKTNENITLAAVRRRINEAVDFFSVMYDRMFVKDKITINCTDIKIFYDMPITTIGISKVLNSKDEKYKDYEMFNSGIRFNDTGSYTIIYKIKPNLQTTKDSNLMKNEVVNVNPLFLRALIFYVLSTIEKDANKSLNYMSTANKLADEANFMAKKQDNSKPRRISVRPFR